MKSIVTRNISNYTDSYRIEFDVSDKNNLIFLIQLYFTMNFVEGPALNLYINLTPAMRQIKTFYFTKIQFSVEVPGDYVLNSNDKRVVENSAAASKLGQDLGKAILVMQSIWSVGSSFVLKGLMVMEMINLLRYIDIK
jgi:hypothetical protein